MFSTTDVFRRQVLGGGLSLVIKVAKEHNIKVRILVPMDNEIKKIFHDIKN
jgi:hypothetical protein